MKGWALGALLLAQSPSTWRLATPECQPCDVVVPHVKACSEAAEAQRVTCFDGAMKARRDVTARFHRQGVDLVYVGSRDGGVTELGFVREDVCGSVYRRQCPRLPPHPRDGCEGPMTPVCQGAEWNYGPARPMGTLCKSGAAYEACDGGAKADFPERGERVICVPAQGAELTCMPEGRWFGSIGRP